MGAQFIGGLVMQASENGRRFEQAAANARFAGDYRLEHHFGRMASYCAWRVDQLCLVKIGGRQQLPTYAEWQRSGLPGIDVQQSFGFAT